MKTKITNDYDQLREGTYLLVICTQHRQPSIPRQEVFTNIKTDRQRLASYI